MKDDDKRKNKTRAEIDHNNGGDDDEDDADIAFATMDFSGVNFDEPKTMEEQQQQGKVVASMASDKNLAIVEQWEQDTAFQDYNWATSTDDEDDAAHNKNNDQRRQAIRQLGQWMAHGQYLRVLYYDDDNNNNDKQRSTTHDEPQSIAQQLFAGPYTGTLASMSNTSGGGGGGGPIWQSLHHRIHDMLQAFPTTTADDSSLRSTQLMMFALELVAIAALNLFCQANYTGPAQLDKEPSTSTTTPTTMDDEPNKTPPPPTNAQLLSHVHPHDSMTTVLEEASNHHHHTDNESSSKKSTRVILPPWNPNPEDSKQMDDFPDNHPKDETKSLIPDHPETTTTTTTVSSKVERGRDSRYHNAILAELAVEGEWPCPVCDYPYFLLVARAILTALVQQQHHHPTLQGGPEPGRLKGLYLWHARALVAHVRLLQTKVGEVPPSLEEEVLNAFERVTVLFQSSSSLEPTNTSRQSRLATVWLERGLAHYHLHLPNHHQENGKPMNRLAPSPSASVPEPSTLVVSGRSCFVHAQTCSGLQVQLTGAMGKRTKYQQEAKAQLRVHARSKANPRRHGLDAPEPQPRDNATTNNDESLSPPIETTDRKAKKRESDVTDVSSKPTIQPVDHPEDTILLDRIQFEQDDGNTPLSEQDDPPLSRLDQAIILALCLDVKNSNPSADVLTAEEMGAFLARVLDDSYQSHDQKDDEKKSDALSHHPDWMIYSTALLERAWLEFERPHTKERAILQLQALVDQHDTHRLTMTQSTHSSITTDAAPVQLRLQNLHTLVYPPRWAFLNDLAHRYAHLGLVTSAAELYTEIELWDDVVDCYTRAGKRSKAQAIVRERLLHDAETPRRWTALGDLTQDISCYQKAITVSHGRYAKAYIALGQHYFEKNELTLALENYHQALQLRPLAPHIWFRYGTIAMRLEQWDVALSAFSEVVQQEPEEAEAWANVAAVHMHNRCPDQAYPALKESLRYQRNNWRVWTSQLYTCLDLQKWDEALQACQMLLDLYHSRGQADSVPPLEEKCVRALVGGALQTYLQQREEQALSSSLSTGTETASPMVGSLEAARRTLLRTHELLESIGSSATSATNMPWVMECLRFLQEQMGAEDKVLLEYLMQVSPNNTWFAGEMMQTDSHSLTFPSLPVVYTVLGIPYLAKCSTMGTR